MRRRNWAGNLKFSQSRTESPRSLEELCRVVREAPLVKALGSGHSFSDVANSQGVLILTDNLKQVLDVDPHRGLVRVEAGIKLFELNSLLHQHGLCLPSLGDIDRQSLAGVVSTGTHGTGMAWGSFSDEEVVRGIDLVLANGELLSLSADREGDREALRAARLSLGTLGVIHAITLQAAPAHRLEHRSSVMSLTDALQPKHYLENDHFEFFSFPYSDQVLAIFRNKTDEPLRQRSVARFFNDIVMENWVLESVLRLSSRRPSTIRKLMPLLPRLAGETQYVDHSHRVMIATRSGKFYETEYAFPISLAADALQAHANVCEHHAGSSSDFYPNYPTEVRFTREDRGNMLSPTQGEPSVFVSVHTHPAFGQGYRSFFEDLSREFSALGGRPHWGKLFWENPRKTYEEFPAFLKHREECDPGGKFLNPFFKRLMEENT